MILKAGLELIQTHTLPYLLDTSGLTRGLDVCLHQNGIQAEILIPVEHARILFKNCMSLMSTGECYSFTIRPATSKDVRLFASFSGLETELRTFLTHTLQLHGKLVLCALSPDGYEFLRVLSHTPQNWDCPEPLQEYECMQGRYGIDFPLDAISFHFIESLES